jgi:site-specific DNA-methyltransferase (adenine-specific)
VNFESVAIADLKPLPKNARKHSKRNLNVIKKSLEECGQQKPIVIDAGNTVIAGNGTLAAAKLLGWKEIWVHRTALDPGRAELFAILDNRAAELAEWDVDELTGALDQLEKDGWEMDQFGWDDKEREKIRPKVSKEGMTDDDAVPEVVETRCQLGDLWQLGDHRLLCGDSTDVLCVERLMGGVKASVWLSDPPYGINHVEVSNEKGQSKGYAKIANDDLKDDEFKDFIFAVISASLPHMKKGFAFYMWHAMKMQGYTAAAAAAAAGILFHRQIIWVKPQFVFGRGHYHWRHELCLMGWLQGNEPEFYGERNQSTVWECSRENDKIHPTQKPVDLLAPSITNHTITGEVVYEPFSGSGSTLIACEKTNRTCYGMEIDPHYCDVIITRWENFTGKKAILSTGEGSGNG